MRQFVTVFLLFILLFSSISNGATVFLGNDTALCGASYYVLDAGSGFKAYQWSTGDSTQFIVISSTGTYGVKVKDAQNKISSDQIHVVFSDYPIVNLGNDTTLCTKKQVTLAAGANTNDYIWSTGDTTSKIIISSTGTYAVTVTNAYGCSSYDSIHVIFTTHPKVNLGTDSVLCDGGTLTLNAGNNYVEYLWSTGDSVPSIVVTQSGKYIVKVKDDVGCITKDKINVVIDTVPNVHLPQTVTLCDQANITLSVNTFYKTYYWSTGDSTKKIQISYTGLYHVYVTDIFGCASSDSTLVVKDSLAKVDLGVDKIVCQGDSVVLDAGSGSLAYLWWNGDTIETNTISASGTYYVYVKKQNECISSDTIQITYSNAKPIDLGNNLFTCLGDSIMVDAGAGYVEYHWSTQDTTQQTYADTDGVYFIVAIDTNGCVNSGIVDVFSNGIAPVNLGADTCMSDPFRLYAGDKFISYVWSTGETDSAIIVQTPGIYYVNVTDSSGCSSSDTIVVTKCVTHGIENSNINNALHYNNPIKDNLLIDYDQNILSIEKIEIINALGQIQFSDKNFAGNQININTHFLQSGSFWFRAYTNQGILSKQIIKVY